MEDTLETRWHELVILDYELDFPQNSLLELALYSLGAARFTRVVLGEEELWGVHRRPGILEVKEPEYERALNLFACKAQDLPFVCSLTSKFMDLQAQLERANRPVEDDLRAIADPGVALDLLRHIVELLANLMAFHVLNWSVPYDAMAKYLGDVLGSPDTGRESLMAMLVPYTSAHLTDFFEVVTTASAEMELGTWDDERSRAVADAIGHLQAPGLAERAFENPRTLGDYLASLGDCEFEQLPRMTAARLAAKRALARKVSELYLATDGSAGALAEAAAVVGMCRLAAEEEERRRRWQSRALRNVRLVAHEFSIAFDELIPLDCLRPEGEVEVPRLLAPHGTSWKWLHVD
jgi:hypothetical protein